MRKHFLIYALSFLLLVSAGCQAQSGGSSQGREIPYEKCSQFTQELEAYFSAYGNSLKIGVMGAEDGVDVFLHFPGMPLRVQFPDFANALVVQSEEIAQRLDVPVRSIETAFTTGSENEKIIRWETKDGVTGTLADNYEGNVVLTGQTIGDLVARYGCTNEFYDLTSGSNSSEGGETVSYDWFGITLRIPEDWEIHLSEEEIAAQDEPNQHFYPEQTDTLPFLMLQYMSGSYRDVSKPELMEAYVEGVGKGVDNYVPGDTAPFSVCGKDAFRFSFSGTISGVPLSADQAVFAGDDGALYIVSMAVSPDSTVSYQNDFEAIIDSIEFKEAARAEPDALEEAAQPAEPESAQTPAPAAPTTGERNALGRAHEYLNYSAFSYSGLIDQLKYEGFSDSEAQYAADHCGADWNEQAAKRAAEYLDYSSFSRSGLIEQLEYEGFTRSQAEYGVTAVGY